jgi:hypothetical protein
VARFLGPDRGDEVGHLDRRATVERHQDAAPVAGRNGR